MVINTRTERLSIASRVLRASINCQLAIFLLIYHHSRQSKSNFHSRLVSTAMAHLSDSKLPKDEALRLLRLEMQRCLGSLKGKRQKISQLQEELQVSRGRLTALQTQLDEATLCSSVRTALCDQR